MKTLTIPILLLIVLLFLPCFLSADQQAAQKEDLLKNVETIPAKSKVHIKAGEKWNYRDTPPTSGPHAPRSIKPGFFHIQQPFERLVHSLEHGHIVIYYNLDDKKIIEKLMILSDKYCNEKIGLVVTPLNDMAEEVILTAWTKRLKLSKFDEPAILAFINAFLGLGPEKI